MSHNPMGFYGLIQGYSFTFIFTSIRFYVKMWTGYMLFLDKISSFEEDRKQGNLSEYQICQYGIQVLYYAGSFHLGLLYSPYIVHTKECAQFRYA
jgi:hypothetical protein